MNETYKLLGEGYPNMETLLNKASEICTQFFKEENLCKLIKLNSRLSAIDFENA
jgi:hypothetical protein